MAITVNPDAIPHDDIGNEIVLIQLDGSTYAPVTTLTAGTTVAYIKDLANSDIIQAPEKSVKKNEKGEDRAVSYKRNLVITGMVMQGDKGTLDYLDQYVDGKTFLHFKKTGPVDDLDQWHCCIAKVTPQKKISRGTGDTNTPYEAIAVIPQSAITYTSTFLASVIATLAGSPYFLTDFPNAEITVPTKYGDVVLEGTF